MMKRAVQLRADWLSPLKEQFESEYMERLRRFLLSEKKAGREIYPPSGEWFAALNATPPDEVKVVILGQDPYHGPGQAHGLSFSVRGGQRIPPSLQNMFRELSSDLGCDPPSHGDLSSWAEQGVLMLNSVLTVERGRAGSHQGKGWERFTDAVIRVISRRPLPVVFLLWGAQAQRKGAAIDTRRHCVLAAPHPSPLSAHRGFVGCRHFSAANRFLMEHHRDPVDWSCSS
jgi:uracil-DNA glycosylase